MTHENTDKQLKLPKTIDNYYVKNKKLKNHILFVLQKIYKHFFFFDKIITNCKKKRL